VISSRLRGVDVELRRSRSSRPSGVTESGFEGLGAAGVDIVGNVVLDPGKPLFDGLEPLLETFDAACEFGVTSRARL